MADSAILTRASIGAVKNDKAELQVQKIQLEHKIAKLQARKAKGKKTISFLSSKPIDEEIVKLKLSLRMVEKALRKL